jgi:quercetin dioxygenase-like cupin family protein
VAIRIRIRICIVRCGAIGGVFAAHLAQFGDVEVWADDASEEHVAAINAHGLRLTGHADLSAEVNARTDPDDIPPCAFGIVATKGMFTRRAIEATRHLFADAACRPSDAARSRPDVRRREDVDRTVRTAERDGWGGAGMNEPQRIRWDEQEFTEVRPGIFGATVHTPQLTATLYRYEPGSTWEEHEHPQDQMTTVLEGAIDFVVAGERVHLEPGELAALPGGTAHSARTPEQGAVTLNVFTSRKAPPRV